MNYKRYTETEYNLSENVCGIENNRVKPAMRCANSFTFFFFFFFFVISPKESFIALFAFLRGSFDHKINSSLSNSPYI